MKISPLAQGTGTPAGSDVGLGRSVSPERAARAKAVALGQNPVTAEQQTQQNEPKEQSNVKRIKMRTQRSVYRDLPQETLDALPLATDPESDISDVSEQAVVKEVTQPLSPQFAALAKAKRALQEERKALDAEKAALKQNTGFNADEYVSKSDLKARRLSVLHELGVTNDQLTEDLLSQQNEQSPALAKLEAKLSAVEERLENQNKTQAQREEAAQEQALDQMEREASKLMAQGDEYEMVRETGSIKEVRRLIKETFLKTGEVLDIEEALQLVEDELIEDSLKIARIKKVQSKLTPALPQQSQPQQTNSNVRVMRTLTNRDGASVPSSARDRAMAAFHGRKL